MTTEFRSKHYRRVVSQNGRPSFHQRDERTARLEKRIIELEENQEKMMVHLHEIALALVEGHNK